MRCIFSAASVLPSLLPCVSLANLAFAHDYDSHLHHSYGDVSAKSILANSIRALGGQEALDSLQTISSHAYIWRSFSVGQSDLPGVGDVGVVVAGERTVSFNISDPTAVVQRIDRKDVRIRMGTCFPSGTLADPFAHRS